MVKYKRVFFGHEKKEKIICSFPAIDAIHIPNFCLKELLFRSGDAYNEKFSKFGQQTTATIIILINFVIKI